MTNHSSKMSVYFLTLTAVTCWIVSVVTADLSDVLHHFETISSSKIHTRTKRDVNDQEEKHVTFDSMGRHFYLKLHKNTEVLAPGFRTIAIDKDSNEREVNLDFGSVYHGVDMNDPGSYVQAYWEDGNLVSTISSGNETYVIEPSWRHLPDSEDTMFVYRKSDVRADSDMGDSYCGYVNPEKDEASYDSVDHNMEKPYQETGQFDGSKRKKRATFTPTKNRCPLLLVADYRFFENMGQSSLSKTTSYLIGLIDRVDKIYKETDFGNGYINMGFEIKEIRIHEAPTVTTSGDNHYNEERDTWETKPLLETFSRDARFKSYCLAHLFTYLPFDGGVLGLAYIASQRTYSVGGVCSPSYYKQGYQLYLNTGWSSSLNRYKRRLLTSEADLVTTHEFGHNWGSEHDPPSDECSPGSFSGGKHIMYTYSVSGYDENNKIFSPCSKRSIGAVLDAKHTKCFTAPEAAYCGNSKVEEGEECDVGPATKKGNHPCCTKYCKFKPQAQCCDSNHVCCASCQFIAKDTQCYEEGPCEQESVCSGDSHECPDPEDKDDDAECFQKGKCKKGQCHPFCESNGRISCICDEEESQYCKYCCRENHNSTCEPFDPSGVPANLPDGMPCLKGYCHEGLCEQQVQDLVERLWDVIENLNPSTLAAFMRANIVGVVIIISLIIWIPASCAIHYVDKKRREEDEKQIEWNKRDNESLVLPSDHDRIIHGHEPRRVRSSRTPRGAPVNVVRESQVPFIHKPLSYHA